MPKETKQSTDITFAPNKWLNDREIEWAYQEIAKNSKRKHAFISVFDFLLAEARTDYDANARLFNELSKTDVELVFIPVNNPDTHWSLIVYEVKENKFYHLDSSRQKLNEQYIQKFINHYCQHKNASFEDVNECPLQPNADDCGVYLLTFTRLLAENPELLRTGIPSIDSKEERNYWNKEKLEESLYPLNHDFDPCLKNLWKEQGFTTEQVNEWISVGLQFTDYDLASYLREKEHQVKNQYLNLADLRKKFSNSLKLQYIHQDFSQERYKYYAWGKEFPGYEEIKQWMEIGLQPSSCFLMIEEWKKHGFVLEQAKQWRKAGFEKYYDIGLVGEWKNKGFSYEEARHLMEMGFDKLDYEIAKEWKNEGFALNQIQEWIKAGLKKDETEFANHLQKKDYQPTSPNIKEIIQRESWQDINQDFSYRGRKEWERKNFNHEQVQKWIKVGLKAKDDDYARWLRDNKKIDAEWVSNNSDKQLKEEYKNNSRFSEEIIKQIKNFNHNELTIEQELLIEKLISNVKLRKRYKENGLCKECWQPNAWSYGEESWCQVCNAKYFARDFNKWTSGNLEIDKFVQKSQLEATNSGRVLEWIPYERFTNIEFLAEGGFGKVYKAEWIDGTIEKIEFNWWDKLMMVVFNKSSKWKRCGSKKVALKILYNSQDITTDFLKEVAGHALFGGEDYFGIVRCHGISQDPKTKNYVMVMDYIEGSNLRKYLNHSETHVLSNYYESRIDYKLSKLIEIIVGLESIHKKGLIHRDFHPGNILNGEVGNPGIYITDLGLCRPANEKEQERKVFGVLPYIAPEVLKEKGHSKASDIYSFAIVTYELFSKKSPYEFYDKKEKLYKEMDYNEFLAIKICQGLRPNLNEVKVPQLLKNLIGQCWNADPKERPAANKIREALENWRLEIRDKKDTEFYRQYKELEVEKKEEDFNEFPFILSNDARFQFICRSCLLDFKNLPKPRNSREINEKFWNSNKKNISQSMKFDMSEVQEDLEEINEQDWTNLHHNFTPSLIQSWQNLNFTYQQTHDWLSIGLNPTDFNFASYLRDHKHLTPETALNHHNEQELRAEFQTYQFQLTSQTLQPPK